MNNRITVYISLLILTAVNTSCSKKVYPTSKVDYLSGTYETNVSPFGLSSIKIDFIENGTCIFENSRHMQETFSLYGKYLISDKDLYIRLQEPEDISNEFTEAIDSTWKFWTILDEFNRYQLKEENNIEYHLKYLIEDQKLYGYNVDNDKLVREAITYTEEKGRHKVPYYLKKRSRQSIENHEWFIKN